MLFRVAGPLGLLQAMTHSSGVHAGHGSARFWCAMGGTGECCLYSARWARLARSGCGAWRRMGLRCPAAASRARLAVQRLRTKIAPKVSVPV